MPEGKGRAVGIVNIAHSALVSLTFVRPVVFAIHSGKAGGLEPQLTLGYSFKWLVKPNPIHRAKANGAFGALWVCRWVTAVSRGVV